MIYGKNADSWADDNINSLNAQDKAYAADLNNKQGYRTCEPGCLVLGLSGVWFEGLHAAGSAASGGAAGEGARGR